MSSQIRAFMNKLEQQITRAEDFKLWKHLNADALVTTMRTGFAGIRDHRSGKVAHTLATALMRMAA